MKEDGGAHAGPRMEPKVVFANERTYVAWVKMAVTLGGIGAGLLGAASDQATGESMHDGVVHEATSVAKLIGMILLPVGIVFALHAAYTFRTRTAKIVNRDYAHISNETGPLVLGAFLVLALTAVLVVDVLVGGSVKLK